MESQQQAQSPSEPARARARLPARRPAPAAGPLWQRISSLLGRVATGWSAAAPALESPAVRRALRSIPRLVAEEQLGSEAATRYARQVIEAFPLASSAEREALALALAHGAHRIMGQRPDTAAAHFEAVFRLVHGAAGGLPFLVALRGELLALAPRVAGAAFLERELKRLLVKWFEVARLDFRRLNWDSPASLLEKLIRYEAVHAITSWMDLRKRLGADRECFALFHPAMPEEPLIFVEVAFTEELAQRIDDLLDTDAPTLATATTRWAIFYSISSTQTGLRGVSLGGFLLKRAIADLQTRYPRLRGFSTLSPIPGLRSWLEALSAEQLDATIGSAALRRIKRRAGASQADTAALSGRWLATEIEGDTLAGVQGGELLELATRLCARYLVERTVTGDLRDPVARFHLGNGARIERINSAADCSEKSLRESMGLMVNYRYVPDDLDVNIARLVGGRPQMSRGVGRLL